MDIGLFLRGLVFGVSIAAPVGPIGILCIRRTLSFGRLAGLLTGLGVATADALYGSIAGLGLTLISNLLIDQVVWLRLLGGVFLCYLGIKTLRSRPANEAALSSDQASTKTYASLYVSAVFLTLTNPMTILSFTVAFAGLGLVTTRSSPWTAMTLITSVFIGSALWWLILTLGISLLRHKLDLRQMRWLNRISGLMLLIFGIIALHIGH
jgi:threonine/homoserine/homoserine lactone efflux protein